MFNVTEVKRQISSPTYYLALRHLNIYHLLLYRSINWLEILIEMDAKLSTLQNKGYNREIYKEWRLTCGQ